jgi:hypothetical protein
MFPDIYEIQRLWPEKDCLLCDNELVGAFGPNIYIGTTDSRFNHFEKRQVRRTSATFFRFLTWLPTLAAALAILCTGSALASTSFVQGNYTVLNPSASVVVAPYTKGQATGDLNVVIVGWNDTTANISSVIDTVGNVYLLAGGPTQISGTASQSIFYAKNIRAAGAGANTVTVTFNTAAAYPDLRILEYSGISTLNAVDVFVGATGNGTTSSSGAVTTTNAADLLVGANYVQTSTSGSGTGFTQRLLTTPDGDIAEDSVVSATGSYSATAPLGLQGWSVTQMVAFRFASAPTPTPTPTPTPATPKYIQGNSAVPLTAQTVALPYTAAQGTGDLNAVIVGWSNPAANVSSVTDTMGNVYQLAVGPTQLNGIASQSIFYAKNILPAPGGANAVTVTFNTSAIFPDIRILEYSGIDPIDPVDVVAGATGNSTTSSSGAVTTTTTMDLLLGANYVQTWTAGAGGGFTQRLLTAPNGDIAEDDVVTGAASYSATAPLGLAGGWVTQMVAFRAAGSQSQAPAAPSSDGVTLAWNANAATSNSSTNTVGYRLHIGSTSGTYTQTTDVGNTTSVTVSSLTSGVTYYCVVAAYNAAGAESPYSNEVSYQAP